MKIIKNKKQLAKILDENKDISIDEDLRIEYQLKSGEIRDIKCFDLFLGKNEELFDFYGRDLNILDFTGGDFNGGDFKGWNFNGRNISFHTSFICHGNCKCEKWESNRKYNTGIICLDGELEIKDNTKIKEAIKLLEDKGHLVEGKILNYKK